MNDVHAPFGDSNDDPSRSPLREEQLEQLTRYVLGECSVEERAQVEAELATSLVMREELALLQDALRAMREVHERGVSPVLAQERREALVLAASGTLSRSRLRSRFGLPLAAAAAVVLGVSSAAWWFQHRGTGSTAGPEPRIAARDVTPPVPSVESVVPSDSSTLAGILASDDLAAMPGTPNSTPPGGSQGDPLSTAYSVSGTPGASSDSSSGLGTDVDGEEAGQGGALAPDQRTRAAAPTASLHFQGEVDESVRARTETLFTEAATGIPDASGGGSLRDQAFRSMGDDPALDAYGIRALDTQLGTSVLELTTTTAAMDPNGGSSGVPTTFYAVPDSGVTDPSLHWSLSTGSDLPTGNGWFEDPNGLGVDSDDFEVEIAQGAVVAEGLDSTRAFRDGLGGNEPGRGIDPAIGRVGISIRNPNRTRPARADQILESLARRPGETPSAMFFRYWGDHDFEETALDAQSTFGLDVDTASFSLSRNYLANGHLPPKEAVRTEEFLNTFDYDLAPPKAAAGATAPAFAIHTELAASPFGAEGQKMLMVGLKAREISRAERPPVALTFVIDESGSMKEGGRLELVKQSLHVLVDQLDERDTVGLVAFASDARRVLEPHSVQHREVILAAIDSLEPDGSTNAAAGLELGYPMALGQFRAEAQNRVFLCSDGVANTGDTDVDTMLANVERMREEDIFLQCVGVGMGNHNDVLLEQLADRGDGACAYVDTLREARRLFVEDLTGTLLTVAADAKAQVTFDPERVVRYRLLGYENRAIADRDFRNDSVDAGEIGAGHEVIALYELELREGANLAADEVPLAEVSLRYRDLALGEVVEQSAAVGAEIATPSARFELATGAAEFAEILRRSVWAEGSTLAALAERIAPLEAKFDGAEPVAEFVALVRRAAQLPGLFPEPSALGQLTQAMKRNRVLEARVRELEARQASTEQAAMLQEIETQNARLEARLRELLKGGSR